MTSYILAKFSFIILNEIPIFNCEIDLVFRLVLEEFWSVLDHKNVGGGALTEKKTKFVFQSDT
jgi:hypothetical protein